MTRNQNLKPKYQKLLIPLFIQYKKFITFINMEEKNCSRCGILKPLVEFDKNPNGKEGRSARCKECRKEIDYRNKEKVGTPLEMSEDIHAKQGSIELLTSLGYKLNDPNMSVHEQFMVRYNKWRMKKGL